MAINAGSVFVNLGAKIDRTEFAAYDRELQKVRHKASEQARFKAELGGDYNPRAFNAYYRDLEKSQVKTDQMVKTHGKLTGALKSTVGLAVAAGGFSALGAAVLSTSKAYGESQASQERMERQLKASGTTYQEHKKQIDEVVASVSNLAAVDDEDLQDAFTNILRSTGSVNKSLRLLTVTTDISAAKHIDLSKAGQLVGKVAAGNVSALSRYGIQIDKGATATEALGILQRKFAGQAETYGKTQQGATARLQNSFENLQESIGQATGPFLTNASNKLAKFFDQMRTGEGAGGGFVKVMRALGVTLRALGAAWIATIRSIDDFIDRMLGASTTVLGAIEKIADAGAKLPGRFGRPFRDAADKIHQVRKSLDDAREGFRLVAHPIDDVATRLRKMSKSGQDSLGDIRRATKSAMAEIRQRLGSDSNAGQQALGKNFRQAEKAIQDAMRAGKIATRDGLAEIQALMSKELKLYGIDPGNINAAPLSKSKGPIHTINRADGGWIGQRGMAGGDTVPAMLGVGEAVLNRHQQGVIEALLGDGFLDMLFARVNRPHYMASGGIAGAVSAANQFERAGFPYRWGGGHERSPTPFEPVDCSGAVSYVLQHAGVNIPTMVSGQLASAGKPGAGALTVFANPVHTFMRIGSRYFGTSGSNPGGGAGWFDDPGEAYKSRFAVRHFDAGDGIGSSISAPRIRGGGTLGRIVQGAMNTAARGANSALDKALGSMGLGTGDPGDPGPTPRGSYGKGDLARLWTGAGGPKNVASLMAAIALAESNGNPRAHNPSGATGLWQILGNPFPGDAYNPATNARMAVAKYHTQGLGAWEAYTNGAYRQYLASGGRAKGELKWLQSAWSKTAGLFGMKGDARTFRGLFKHIGLGSGSPFVGVSRDAGAGAESSELYWPKWLYAGTKGQRPLDRRSKLQLFIHEMAHRFQSDAETGTGWEAEGGAEAFARLVMDRRFGGAVRDPSDPYNGDVKKVIGNHSRRWINKTQFGMAGGGILRAAGGFRGYDTSIAGRNARAPRSGSGSRYLPLPRGWGWDYVKGKVFDIFSPQDDFGPATRRSLGLYGAAAARAAVDTPNDLTDDFRVAQQVQELYQQIYNSRLFTHAPTAKIQAAAEALATARETSAGIFRDIAAPVLQKKQDDIDFLTAWKAAEDAAKEPNTQAILDQTTARLAAVQGNLAAAQRVQQTFTSSGDIGFGGFGNAWSAARMAPRITINTLHPGDPQTLVAIGNAATAGQSLQPSVSTTRSTVGV